MSIIDQAMKANEQFAKRYDPKLGGHPQPQIAIVTCMDPRLSDLEGIPGIEDCGYGRHPHWRPKELNEKLAKETGDATPAPMRFFSYKDPEENTREQIEKVRAHPWIAKDVPVRGFIFDVDTGRLREVTAGSATSTASGHSREKHSAGGREKSKR